MQTLYRELAGDLARQISEGVYVAGERLPGVRGMASERSVSIATVVAAYQALEDDGFVESRPRSGFYVRARQALAGLELAGAAEASPPQPVTRQQMTMALIKGANDPGMVQLGAAVPDPSYLPTVAVERALTRAARQHRARAAGYMMPPGAPELRRQLARRAAESGQRLDPDEVVITSGCQEALSLALRAVTRAGDVVAVESPAFYGLLHILEAQGLEVLEIPSHPQEGMSIDALAFALSRWKVAACVVVPNVNNPLGFCMSDEHKRALVRLLMRHGVTMIEDDVYGDLCFSQRRPATCRALVPEADIIYCSSFSKTLSPGLRVGWLAAGRHLARIEHLKYVNNIASASVPQLAVADLLESGRYERYLREIRGKYASAVARMSDALLRLFPEGTRISQPQGGFVLWLELPEDVDAFLLAKRALAHGISVAPGALFTVGNHFRNHLRITSARVWEPRLERALGTLARLVPE